jgi:hypothetical protein
MTAQERKLRASIAAHSKHALYDPTESTAAARSAFLSTFERQADPTGTVPPEERARRAQHLRTAHMKRLALRSARARRGKAS